MDDEEITNGLYECFNLMRTTVEGIVPYKNDGRNIWNIPGSLKRVKRASLKILTFGLRNNKLSLEEEKYEDKLKVCTAFFYFIHCLYKSGSQLNTLLPFKTLTS